MKIGGMERRVKELEEQQKNLTAQLEAQTSSPSLHFGATITLFGKSSKEKEKSKEKLNGDAMTARPGNN